jgi:hypothetical protein
MNLEAVLEGGQDIVDYDLDGKMKLLSEVMQQMLDYQVEFAEVSGRYATLRANITVLKEVKSALQSAIRAEQRM